MSRGFRRPNEMCRLIAWTWWPSYYRGRDGRTMKFHPFKRAAPCFVPSIVRNPLAGIRRRQMRERIHRLAAPKAFNAFRVGAHRTGGYRIRRREFGKRL